MTKGVPISGKLLAKMRRDAALSQADLALKSSVSIASIKRYESQKLAICGYRQFTALCKALGIRPEQLMQNPPASHGSRLPPTELTIALPDRTMGRLETLAEQQGITPAVYAAQLLEAALAGPSRLPSVVIRK